MTRRRDKPAPATAMFMALLIALLASAPALAATGQYAGACGGMTHPMAPMAMTSVADAQPDSMPGRGTGSPAADTGCALDCCVLCAPVLISAPRLPGGEPITHAPFAVPARAADSLHNTPTLPPPRRSA